MQKDGQRQVGVIDVGLGNVGSVLRMIEKAGGSGARVGEPRQLAEFTKLILPGVGHFDHGMSLLNQTGFTHALRTLAADGETQILGICLGMQLLFEQSEEGEARGLSLVRGRVVRLQPQDPSLPVPHMGWNEVKMTRPNALLHEKQEDGRNSRYYFVHSFHARCDDPDDVIGVALYGEPVTAGIQSGRIWGTQFHPEKSHRFGLSLMRRFLDL